jgi:hypothetical protein
VELKSLLEENDIPAKETAKNLPNSVKIMVSS